MNKNIKISAETKIGELLEVFPQLENYLIQLSPVYKNLKNPILRKTVAKVATLEQVARVGNMECKDLIHNISTFLHIEGHVKEHEAQDDEKIPENLNITERIDARPMLARNEHPVGIVLKKLTGLNTGEGIELISPFVPAPLLEKIKENGGKAVCVKVGDEEFVTTIWIEAS